MAGTGFVLRYSFCTTPNSIEGGIWQSGYGLATDGTYIYLSVGNAAFDIANGDYGMTFLKLSLDLKVVDYFSPANEAAWSSADLDTGSSAAVLLPGSSLFLGGVTKYGEMLLLNSSNLGQFNSKADTSVQTISMGSWNNFAYTPVVWNNGTTTLVYTWGKGNPLQQFVFNGTWVTKINSINDNTGAALAITSNAGTSGLLWAITVNAVLQVYDANTLQQLWSSSISSARDSVGSIGHWQFPTVVNGKAYIPTGGNDLLVYGIVANSTFSTSFPVPSVPPTLTTMPSSSSQSFNSSATSTIPVALLYAFVMLLLRTLHQ